jgi:hypothetical protein
LDTCKKKGKNLIPFIKGNYYLSYYNIMSSLIQTLNDLITEIQRDAAVAAADASRARNRVENVQARELLRNKEKEFAAARAKIIRGLETAISDHERATALAPVEGAHAGRKSVLDTMRTALDEQDKGIKESARAVAGVEEEDDDIDESDPDILSLDRHGINQELWIATLTLVGGHRAQALKLLKAIKHPRTVLDALTPAASPAPATSAPATSAPAASPAPATSAPATSAPAAGDEMPIEQAWEQGMIKPYEYLRRVVAGDNIYKSSSSSNPQLLAALMKKEDKARARARQKPADGGSRRRRQSRKKTRTRNNKNTNRKLK